MPRRIGNPLGVIAGARRAHATRPLIFRKMSHPVIGASQLVGEDRLQVFPFQEHVMSGPLREPPRRIERRGGDHVVDAAVQDRPQHPVGTHDTPNEQMSFRIPAAVTCGPAPGPLITSGSCRYRRDWKVTMFCVPLAAPIGLAAGTPRRPTLTVRFVAETT